jgi:drug/metabolite transporter (DMT)-like permease
VAAWHSWHDAIGEATDLATTGASAPSASARAAALMVLVAGLTAVDTALVRVLTADVHPFVIGFFRSAFGLVAVLPWILRERRSLFRTDHLRLHALRAAVKLLALVSFFFAVASAPLAAVTAIAFATPVFVAVGAVLLLGERLPPLRVAAIGLGFVGVLVILRPDAGAFEPGLLFALAGALGLAAIALMLKFLSGRDRSATIVGLNLLLTVPMAAVLAVPVLTPLAPGTLGLLVLQGALGALSMTLVTRAMALADASFLMPIEFLRLPLVAAIAYFAFAELPDAGTWVGGIVIFAATMMLARTSRQLVVRTDPD